MPHKMPHTLPCTWPILLLVAAAVGYPDLLPAYRDLTTKDKVVAEAALAQAAVGIEELKKEVDIRVAAFLQEEAIGQDKASLFSLLRQEVNWQKQSMDRQLPMHGIWRFLDGRQ